MDKKGKIKIALFSLIFVAIISVVAYAVFVLALHDSSASVEPEFVAANSENEFTFNVVNNGPDDINRIEITIPEGFIFDSNSLICPSDWEFKDIIPPIVGCFAGDTGTPLIAGSFYEVKLKAKSPIPIPFEDTSYLWKIETKDMDKATFSSEVQTTVDVTAPTTTIGCNEDSCQEIWYNSNVDINLFCNDASSDCTLDSPKYCFDKTNTCTPNTEFTIPFPISGEGENFVRFSSTDNVGNQEQVNSQNVMIDKNPPIVTIQNPPEGSWQSSFFDVFFEVSDAGELDTCTLFIDDKNEVSIDCKEDKVTINTESCLEGENTCSIIIKAIDMAGNPGSDERIFSIDRSLPSVNVDGAPPVFQKTDATAEVSCNDLLSGCDETSKKLLVSSTKLESCSDDYEDYTFPAVQTISSHSWVCGAALDLAENAGFSVPVEFMVDQIEPTINIIEPEAGSWQNPFFDIFVEIEDLGDSILNECSYEVKSNGVTTKEKITFNCNQDSVNIGVGIGQDCTNEGINACEIIFNANDIAGNDADSTSRTFSIDFTEPDTTKTIGEPKFGEDDKFIRTNTQITLTASDSISGVKKVCYSINEDFPPTCPLGNTVTFNFLEESEHSLEFWAVDNAENEEEHNFRIHFVDDIPPITTKRFAEEFITPDTKITLSANDPEPEHASGVAELFYRTYLCDTEAPDFIPTNSDYVEFTLEESCHVIEFFAVDNLGNTEVTNKQIVFVDDTPPIASKEVGEPEFISGGNSFIRSETSITLSCEDQEQHPSGANEIFFKVYLQDGEVPEEFNLYNGPFTIPEDSLHVLEFFCTDNVGHESETIVQLHNVDNIAPETTKILDGEKKEVENNWFISDVIVTLNCRDAKSGCALTEFSINDDELQTYNPNSKPTLTDEGIIKFCHQSTDNLGNSEDLKDLCQEINIDKTFPTITDLTPEPDSLAFNNEGGVIIFARVCDETSGINEESINLFVDGISTGFDTSPDGKNCVEVITQMHLSEGEHNAEISVEDDAGHSSMEEWEWNVRTKFELALNTHWNLISSPLIPNNKNVDVVFQDIKDSVESVWNYDAFSNKWMGTTPDCPLDVCELLTAFEDGRGYWINMKKPAILVIEGFRLLQGPNLPPAYPVKGNAWNLIGFKSMQGMSAETYLASIWNHLQSPHPLPITVRDGNIISTNDMLSGEGYWLFVKGSDGVIAPPADLA